MVIKYLVLVMYLVSIILFVFIVCVGFYHTCYSIMVVPFSYSVRLTFLPYILYFIIVSRLPYF